MDDKINGVREQKRGMKEVKKGEREKGEREEGEREKGEREEGGAK